MKPYILDACALIAYFNDEQGADAVSECIRDLNNGIILLLLHKINLLEIYYNYYKESGKKLADDVLTDVTSSGIHIINDISNDVLSTAGRLKSTYKISLGDAILLAQAFVNGAAVITCDHHEFDFIEKKEPIVFKWIR